MKPPLRHRASQVLALLRTAPGIVARVRGFVPLTLAGLCIGVAGWAVAEWFGRDRADYVLWAAGASALVLVAGMAAAVMLSSLVLALHLRRACRTPTPEHSIDVGTPLTTGLRYPRFHLWPFVEVSMTWEQPAPVAVQPVARGRWLHEVAIPQERSRIREITRRFTVRDIFGLASVSFPWRSPAAIRVAPARARVHVDVALRDTSGDGWSHPAGKPEGEMIEMRGYSPGDPLRFLLWKTFARTRRLLVRMPERSVSSQKSTVAYLVAGPADEPSASAARTFIEEGLLGTEFMFGADGAGHGARTVEDSVERIIDSAASRDHGGEGLAPLAAEPEVARAARCILFVPGTAGPWLTHVATFAAGLPAPPTVVLAVDGTLEAPRTSLLGRLLEVAAPSPCVPPGLPRLYDSLSALGATVCVLHRPSGRMLARTDIEVLAGQ